MSSEMTMESMEIITMSVDKHAQTKNYEVSLQVRYNVLVTSISPRLQHSL